MKVFVKKIFLFAFVNLFLLFVIGWGYVIVGKYKNKIDKENSVFIWGDSQAKYGIDLKLFSSLLGKKVYSAAGGGAGVYDFLVFAETVPDSSSVILSISELALLREKDKNRLGIPMRYLPILFFNKFPNLHESVIDNKIPKYIYSETFELYPTLDTLTIHEPLSKFWNIYSAKSNLAKTKQELFLKGINRLLSKSCKINFIQFPFHPDLAKVLRNSQSKDEYDFFKERLYNMILGLRLDTITIKSTQRVMYDYTHLNQNGARVTTHFLANKFQQSKNNSPLYIIISN